MAVQVADAPGAGTEPERQTFKPDLERIEIELLLEGIFRHYGFDFRAYAYASIRRRLWKRIEEEGLSSVSALQERVLHEPEMMEKLLLDLSINVTAMFRDPGFYCTFREHVIPLLRTYPFIRIWHAGCSTGEEVYSMAMLLSEEGLYDRSRIYATDINEVVLQRAKAGIFPLERMQEYTDNYIRAGGKRSFSEYYTAKYGGALFDQSLTKNVVFSQHNLVTDRSFSEFTSSSAATFSYTSTRLCSPRCTVSFTTVSRCSECWYLGARKRCASWRVKTVMSRSRPRKKSSGR